MQSIDAFKAIAGLLLLSGCASAVKPPMEAKGAATVAECRAYPDGVAPAGRKVYVVPRPPQPNLPRCSVARLAIATHDLGQFRAVYGDNTPIAPGEAINPVIDDLAAKAQTPAFCRPDSRGQCVFRIIVFAHGGLVSQGQAVADAESLAPAMMTDDYAPVFLIWNSDAATAYGDRLCCVLDGEKDTNRLHQIYFSPVRAVGDVGSSLAKSLENFGQQIIRYDDSVVKRRDTQYYLTADDGQQICELLDNIACHNIIYPFGKRTNDYNLLNGRDQPVSEKTVRYAAGFLPRIGTTAIGPEIGAKAWDNMVRRTRLAVEDSTVTIASRKRSIAPRRAGLVESLATSRDRCRELTQAADDRFKTEYPAPNLRRRIRSRFEPEGEGAFLLFFDRLACEIGNGNFIGPDGKTSVKVEIYYFGHSMGALVGNEILSRHQELPWRRIVYMAAATPVRDFRLMVAPILECQPNALTPSCKDHNAPDYVDLRFYSLMLHPLAESHDLEVWGLVPEGSLLEWIDEMFGGAKSLDDRMFGKWTNVEKTMFMFPPAARERMTFRVFPAQARMRGRAGVEGQVYDSECAPLTGAVKQDAPERCHPIVHGEFAKYSFWREDFLCGSDPCIDQDPPDAPSP